ncbi:transport energizing protein, ExbD/TolR family protein [Teredinibacter turnerae T7901]|uniref:Transport energizing protein, ExbD/TolR family protein n=1 Tax=Teredinibacter turnerae (strain ATCC 39867 / T7901) TaxID=377629 RepID=C5BLP8_TERTT|nr:biopolymer transporter ExbD [Teredinibacter turnerae]ACR12587.1 transport energizing protein, ExbD/TolR family protein [Teredinibacter turnerae T7901]
MNGFSAQEFIGPRRRSDSEGMIPLINIVFLLLIFFMVAGQMSWLSQLNLELPKSNSQQPVDASQPTLAQDAAGQLYFNGDSVSTEELAARLINAAATDTPINISMDKHLTAKELDVVLAQLRQAGIAQFVLYSTVTDDL